MENNGRAQNHKYEDSFKEIKKEYADGKDVKTLVYESLRFTSKIEWDIEIVEYLRKESVEKVMHEKILEFLQRRIQLYGYLNITEINNDILDDYKSSLLMKQIENEKKIQRNYHLKEEMADKISSLQHKIEAIKPVLKNANNAIDLSVRTSRELHAALRTVHQHQRLHPVKRAFSPSYWKVIREYENEHEIQMKITSNHEMRAAIRQEKEAAVKKKAALDKELMHYKISAGELRKQIVRLEKEGEEVELKRKLIELFEREAGNIQTTLSHCIPNS